MKFPVSWLSHEWQQRPKIHRATGEQTPLCSGLMMPWRQLGRGALALVAAALLTACSAVKLAYQQAPDLAYWYLDGYVDLSGVQSLLVKADLAKLQAWHRRTQLPTYADSLRRLQAQMAHDMTADQACKLFAEVRAKAVAVAERAEPAMASLAITLEPPQLAVLQKKFDRLNAEYRERYLDGTPAGMRSDRVARLTRRAEMLYGSLSDAQSALVTQMVMQSRANPALHHAERLRQQRDVLSTLRSVMDQRRDDVEPSAEKVQPTIHALLARTLSSPQAAYRAYQEQFTQEGCGNFAALHNQTSAQQRSLAAQTLQRYEQDLRALAAS